MLPHFSTSSLLGKLIHLQIRLLQQPLGIGDADRVQDIVEAAPDFLPEYFIRIIGIVVEHPCKALQFHLLALIFLYSVPTVPLPLNQSFIFRILFADVFMSDIILQKTEHIFRRMAVVQFPVCHCPIRYPKKTYRTPYGSCPYFPAVPAFYFYSPSRYPHRQKNYALRIHYSMPPTNT